MSRTSVARSLLVIAAMAVLLPATLASQSTPVQGAWVVTSWHSPDGETIAEPQPGLFVFTKTHYSLMFVFGDEARPAYEGEPSAEQIVAAYTPFVANAGRYEVEGDQLTMRAFVAKDPNYMNAWPDNEQTYTFRIDDEGMLHLNFGGPGTGLRAVCRPVDDVEFPGSD